ncbi:hypothetical protein C477_17795 [Haloterrigena salina JCM 13891]|uniref:EamA domain-containing protein n=1 Tax=Haloterrigena salina JCM 13891 TaxID=1227488 RepID=M0BX18_9EURY|nr:hypothetical protein [Haloterrigena salina]ELZ15551.1 hypothetical protein C477_17795 [Haloterrigena salina JCM 13891]
MGRLILLALVTMIAWGLWAVVAGLATDSILPETAMGLSYAAGTLVVAAIIAVVFLGEPLQMTDTAGILLAGIAIALVANWSSSRTSRADRVRSRNTS